MGMDTTDRAQFDLDALNNQITMAEAELKRIQVLVIAEKYAITESVKERKYLEETIDDLNSQVKVAEDQIHDLTERHQKAIDTIKTADEITEQHNQRIANIESTEAKLVQRIESEVIKTAKQKAEIKEYVAELDRDEKYLLKKKEILLKELTK